MTDTAIITNTVATTGITILGVATGLNFEILLAGFAGSLSSLSYLDGMPIPKRCWSLISSSLTAGYMAPAITVKLNSFVGNTDQPPSGVFAAFFIGLVAQVVIPGCIKLTQVFLAKYIAKTE